MSILSKKQAVAFMGLEDKTFDNYFRYGAEFIGLPRVGRGRFYFESEVLERWKSDRDFRTVQLGMDEYKKCLDFALAQNARGYVASDFGTGRQREFGQKITNWVKGQLGELALQKFFRDKFDVEVELDFEIHDEIVPQDITSVKENGAMRSARIGVGIKTSKPKNVFLVLSENEITRPERRSDVYVFCRLDLPDDHLLRLTKETVLSFMNGQRYVDTYADQIQELSAIPCEVVGFCDHTELERVTSIPGQDFEGERYVKKSGLLHRSPDDWRRLISRL